MVKDLTRSIAVIIAGVLGMLGAAYGGGAFGTRPVNEAVDGWLDSDSTLLAPDRPAFSIWSVIYLGLAVYLIWQALPKQRSSERHRKISLWVAATLLLNAAWILVVQADQLILSLIVIVILLITLIKTWLLVLQTPPTSKFDSLITEITVGLYLGWVSVATVANTTAVGASLGLDLGNSGNQVLACVLVFIASGIGITISATSGRLSPAIALGWGLFWIAMGREVAPVSVSVSVCAFIATGLLLVVAGNFRWRRTQQNRRSPHP